MGQSHQQLKQQAKSHEGLVEKSGPRTIATAARPVRHYRAYLAQLYVLAVAAGFGALFVLALSTPYFKIDVTIAHLVQSIQLPGFDWLMQLLTNLGYAPVSFIWCGAIILILFVMGLRWEAVMLLLSVTGVVVLGMLVKDIVQRARPTPDLVNVFKHLSDYSFPSGHVLFYTGLFGFLGFLIFTLAPHSPRRIAGMIVVSAMIILIGVSRVYLGQHWPSDVLGAYLLSNLWLALTIYIYRWGKPRFFQAQPAAPEHPL